MTRIYQVDLDYLGALEYHDLGVLEALAALYTMDQEDLEIL